MRLAVIAARPGGVPVAIAAHDPAVKRVVLKTNDWVLSSIFNQMVDRDLVVQEPAVLSGQPLVFRRKVVKQDARYLDALLDRIVRRPYTVVRIEDIETSARLDEFADRAYREHGGVS